jgi:hypothetical protein
VERALAPSFLRFRIRDVSIPALPEGPTPPPDTVIGAFVRAVEARVAELAPLSGTPGQDPVEELADLREVLRLGRHLLEGRQVTL